VVRVWEAVVAGLSAGRKPVGSVKRSVGRVRSSPSPEGGEDMAIEAWCLFLSLVFWWGSWTDGGVVGLSRIGGLGCGAAPKSPEVAEWGLVTIV